jgi:hypothetical protein
MFQSPLNRGKRPVKAAWTEERSAGILASCMPKLV